MNLKYIVSTAIAVLTYFGLSAITPQEATTRILSNSPRIVEWAMTNEAYGIELQNAAVLPDPEVEGEYLFDQSGGEGRWGVGLSWGLEWPGVYGARKREAKSRLMATKMATVKEIISCKLEVKQLLYDYILQQQQLDLLHSINAVNDSIAKVAEKSGHRGELTVLDLSKIKIENAAISTRIAEIMDSRAATKTSLDAIHGGDCSAILQAMKCEFPNIEVPDTAGITQAIIDSPEMTAAAMEISAMHDALKVAKMESLPGLSIGYKHAYEDDMHFNGASVGITLPIFSRKKKKAAEAQTAVAEFKAAATLDVIQAEINGNIHRLSVLNKYINELTPILADDCNNQVLLNAYKKGAMTLLDFLNERKYFIEASESLLALRHAAASTKLLLEPYFGE